MKFPWQRTDASEAPVTPAETVAETDPETPSVGKGRPTPSRREAQAARKQSLKIPTDPKEAKKAARARAAEQRATEREGLLRGDEAALPARDRGPVRKYVRDFIDGRFALAEMFLPLALFVLALGFVGDERTKAMVTLVWMLLTSLIVIDTCLIMFRLSVRLKERWPEKAERKGTIFYAIMRILQMRRLRLPPPTVTRRGQPIIP